MRLKALVVAGDGLEDYGDLLAIGRAEAKRMLRTHENVNVKDILYSAKCRVHVVVFEVPDKIVERNKLSCTFQVAGLLIFLAILPFALGLQNSQSIYSYGMVNHQTDSYSYHSAFVSRTGNLWPDVVEEEINYFISIVGKGLYAYSVGSVIWWGQDVFPWTSILNYKPLIEKGLIKAIVISLWPSVNNKADDWTVQEIANGEHDTYIAKIANLLKNFEYPIFLRFGAEVNLHQGIYGLYSFGKSPANFVSAFRRVVDIFRGQGASNVLFVWNPNCNDVAGGPAHWTDYYPGDDYVDWVGIDLYQYTEKEDPEPLIAGIYNDYYTKKPVMIAEWGVNWEGENYPDSNRAMFMTRFFDAIEARPNIKFITYWYYSDFMFDPETLPLTTLTYINRISNPRYITYPP